MKTVFIRRCTLAVVLTTGLALGVRPCAATSYIWNVGSGDWSVAANWNPNGVPGANDDASIGGGTATVSTDTTVSNLNFTGGTINGSAALSVASNLTWTAGTMSGSGTTRLLAGGAGVLSGGAFKFLQSGRRLENGGTLSWVGGELIAFAGGIVISNQVGALFEIKENALSLRDEGRVLIFSAGSGFGSG